MSCLFNSSTYSSLSGINSCKFSTGGIKKVWISNYDSNVKNNLTITNQSISDINITLQWFELPLSRQSTRFTENLLSNGNYEQLIEFGIVGMAPNRRLSITNLINGKWFMIIQDLNGYYWFLGLFTGLKNKSYSATTDIFQGVNNYSFVYRSEQSETVIGVSQDYINNAVTIDLDCSLSYPEIALTSEYLLFQFENCIVGNHPDFDE